jgi:hypothetical protein
VLVAFSGVFTERFLHIRSLWSNSIRKVMAAEFFLVGSSVREQLI